MYIPPHFEETDPGEVRAVITANPLATLVAPTAEGLLASHIPVIFDPEGTLIGHFARKNDMWRLIGEGDEVLLIFNGEDTYVSPNWYPSKFEHHKQVPTWNYQTVHVYGHLRIGESVKFRRKVVGLLTKHFETLTNGENGWKMSDAPADYMSRLLDNIVAFEVGVTRTLAKSKLNQNKSREDFENVMRITGENGHAALAGRMRRMDRKD